MLTFEEVAEQLEYKADSGELFWKKEARGGFKNSVVMHRPGEKAGCARPDGRIVVRINGNLYMRYRISWLLATGAWPVGEIDHINGDSADDRLSNLRDVPRQVNQQNIRSALGTKKSTNMLGVYKNKPGRAKPWRAAISDQGKQVYLGAFDTEEEAHEAYLKAKRTLHAGCTI
jgi:hypothetical protein